MTEETFEGLVLRQEDGATRCAVERLTNDDLPAGDVLVDVACSSVNFKDGLAITGSGPIVRKWPMVPGIDLAGTVLESDSDAFSAGDAVLATGWGLGEGHWGGYARRARLPADWLVPMPDGLDATRAMALGTAGLTAMLCVLALEDAGVGPEDGNVLVTGAAGGVGSVATAALARRGYRVSALPGRDDDATRSHLEGLGAADVIHGPEWAERPRPLEKQLWAGVVDTVGTGVLARALAQISYGGAAAICGLAGGADLPTTVMPFILRGVSLRGVDSVMCPAERRAEVWARLAEDLPPELLDRLHRVEPIREAPRLAEEILAGKIQGRVVVSHN